MGVLQRFERRVERLVSGAFARVFKSEVQPVEIASALRRELDNRAAIVSRERTIVPNRFVVELGDRDHERLAQIESALRKEFTDFVQDHAAEQRYSFIGPVNVTFEHTDGLETGVFKIRSSAVAGTSSPSQRSTPASSVESKAEPGPGPYVDVNGMRFAITSPVTVIGRGNNVDVRIDDPGVSRRHAEIRIRDGHATVSDSGSTNGLIVDGRKVAEAALEDGSRVVLGSTTVVYRSGSAGPGERAAGQ